LFMPREPLNVVLVRGFEPRAGLLDLEGLVRQFKEARFDPQGYHVFLLPEYRFGSEFKGLHKRNKAALRRVQELLKGTNWSVAFSVNEGVPSGLSNTGYLERDRGGRAPQNRHAYARS